MSPDKPNFDDASSGGQGGAEPQSSEPTGSASLPAPPTDGRSTAVWRQWLNSMASDAEAALAAAIAYREMDSEGRERWLSSLQFDAPEVEAPAVALYAPLLAVEQDPARRQRLMDAIEEGGAPADFGSEPRSLVGQKPDGMRIFVLSTPLYLSFVQVLACGVKDGCFSWVRHDPIVGHETVPETGDQLEGARLERTPLKAMLDELASAVLSHQRSGRPLPEALEVLVDLLGPLGP